MFGGMHIDRCRACGEPLGYAAKTGSTSCSDSCQQQRRTRRNEHRDSLICQLAALGKPQKEIARLMRLSEPTVSTIINGF
jgi:DNA-binding NarL/FixJ family response regulator